MTETTDHDAKAASEGKSRRSPIKPGVYHQPGAPPVRLVRVHRYRSGMFEVFQFEDENLPAELREKVMRQGGWRDEDRQWYDLVETSGAQRFEVPRRDADATPGLSWEGWTRLGSRYAPLRPCSTCGGAYRHADPEKTVCASCVNEQWQKLDQAIDALLHDVEQAEKLPKGSWQVLKDLRQQVDAAEKAKTFSRVKTVRLRQKLHPVYRLLIDRRKEEQEEYRKLVEELEANVKTVVDRSFASEEPERAVVEELKRIRLRLRELTDSRRLGIREFRKLIGELRRASEREEEKFTSHRRKQEEVERRWEEGERAIAQRVGAIEVGFEHNPANWQQLLELKQEIARRFESGDIGKQGRRRLAETVNDLLDQESTLRELAREEAVVKQRVKKDTSRKRAKALKKSVNNVAIGLGFSQSTWDQLVGIQRDVIRMKNEGAIALDDFKDVFAQVNEKLDTLKKLRGWSKSEGSRGAKGRS
jgi:hypothetical protein